MEDKIEKVINLITAGDLKKALSESQILTQNLNLDYNKTIILLSSRYSNIEKKLINGIARNDDSFEVNNITNSLIQILFELKVTHLHKSNEETISPVFDKHIQNSQNSRDFNKLRSPQLIRVRGDYFMMGGDDIDDQKPKHKVFVRDFHISKYPITFEEYDFYCDMVGVRKPSDQNWGRGQQPLINITWIEAVSYCNWLSRQHNLECVYEIDRNFITIDNDSNGYRLPSEAEWEFAAKGGRQSKNYLFSGSNNIHEVGWFDANSNQKTHEVGLKKSNELGIHDMSGNIWEWCQDTWHPDYQNAPGDSFPWIENGRKEFRMVRGGYWGSSEVDCTVSARCDWREDDLDFDLGFRIARNW